MKKFMINPFKKYAERLERAGYKVHPNGPVDSVDLNSALEIQEEALADMAMFMIRHEDDLKKEFSRYDGKGTFGEFVINLIKELK